MELLNLELKKIKNSSILYLSFLISALSVLIIISSIKKFEKNLAVKYMVLEVLNFSAISYLTMFLPLFCIYLVCCVTKIENDNNGWKQLMLLPVKKSTLYITKYKVMILTLATSVVSYIISVLLGTSFISKEFYFTFELLVYGLKIFIFTLPIIILLFIVGRRFTSVIPVITIGVGMNITNIFIVQSKFWIYAPWTYSMASIGGTITKLEEIIAIVVSLVLSLFMFLLDFNIFKNEDIKEK